MFRLVRPLKLLPNLLRQRAISAPLSSNLISPPLSSNTISAPLSSNAMQAPLRPSVSPQVSTSNPIAGARSYATLGFEFDQGEFLANAPKDKDKDAPISLSGACVALSVKLGGLSALGAPTKIDQSGLPNAEKSAAKQYGYFAALKQAKEELTKSFDESLSPEEKKRLLFELEMKIIRDFTIARSNKMTDADKTIHLNCFETGEPSIGTPTDYISQHGLSPGQTLMLCFSSPKWGGHAVSLSCSPDNKAQLTDVNFGVYDSDQTTPEKVGWDFEHTLDESYPYMNFRGSEVSKFIMPITAIPKEERLPSQTIIAQERNQIDNKIGPNWDPETETPTKETAMKVLVAERDKDTQELLWVAFDMPNGKILKLGGAEIPLKVHAAIQVDQEVSFTPIPRSQVLRDHERAELSSEMQKMEMETSLPTKAVKLQTLVVKRDEKEGLRSAVFQTEDGKLLRLSRAEIPESLHSELGLFNNIVSSLIGAEPPKNLHSELAPGKEFTFKPIPPVLGPAISIPLENMLPLYDARLLTPAEEAEVTNQIPTWKRPKDASVVAPVVPTNLKAIVVNQTGAGKLESAVFQIEGTDKVIKLAAGEIPEEIRKNVKKGETINFKPVPLFEKSLSKEKRKGPSR